MEKLENLFWSKVDIRGPDECWNWTAALYPKGYGQFSTGGRMGYSQQAHRTAYLITHGNIPPVGDIRHLCHNRKCCNHRHLLWGTRKDNMDDQERSGIRPRGDSHHKTKVSDSEANDIRNSLEPLKVLASRYGVSVALISRIRNLKSRLKLQQAIYKPRPLP